MRRGNFWLVAALFLGCAVPRPFALSARDSGKREVAELLASLPAAAPTGPKNRLGKPLAFLVTRSQPQQIVAWDLDAERPLWRVPAAVSSRAPSLGAGDTALISSRCIDSLLRVRMFAPPTR